MDIAPELTMQLPQFFDWSLFWRLTLAAVLGGIVGIEREIHGHHAGLRTNILIATSSCLFTILSIHAFPLVGAAQDTARIAAQIVTGVGFLGAGTLIQTKGSVYGLTTGATIWMVAAVGMAVATDLYLLGVATTVLTTGVLVLLAPLSNWLAAKAESNRMKQQTAEKTTAEEKEETQPKSKA